jgi:hypothetical protein
MTWLAMAEVGVGLLARDEKVLSLSIGLRRQLMFLATVPYRRALDGPRRG